MKNTKIRKLILIIFIFTFNNFLVIADINKNYSVSIFSDDNNLFGCFNKNLKVIIPAKYYDIEIYKNYIYASEYNSDLDITTRHIYDHNGKELFSFEMSYVIEYFNSDDYIYFDDGINSGFYDYKGNIKLKIDEGKINGIYNYGYVPFYDGEYNFFIDETKKKLKSNLLLPLKLYNANSFCDGVAVVEFSKNQYSIINTKGKKILKNTYSFLGEKVKYKRVLASENYKKNTPCIGLIDMNGKYVILPAYYEIIQVSENICFCKDKDNNWIIVNIVTNSYKKLGNKFTFLDYSFEEKILFYVDTTSGSRKYGLMDEYGNQILSPTYDKIKYAYNGYWIVNTNEKTFLFSEDKGLFDASNYLIK